MFQKFKTLINLLSSKKKKEQYISNIVDIFEETLNSDANIKSRKKSSEKKIESFERNVNHVKEFYEIKNID